MHDSKNEMMKPPTDCLMHLAGGDGRCLNCGLDVSLKQHEAQRVVSNDLLSCPFCGADAELVYDKDFPIVYVECQTCFSRGESFNIHSGSIKQKTKIAWNRRAR